MRCMLVLMAATLFVGSTVQAADISLNGPWRFAYTSNLTPATVQTPFTVSKMVPTQPLVPAADQFALDMPVPGYWDENLAYLPETPWGNKISYAYSTPVQFPFLGSGRPARSDTTYPYVVGAGWYKRTIDVPADWEGRTITLRIEGARIDTYCYVNGVYMAMHHGHDTPFEFDLTGELKYGAPNELVLGVDNNIQYINSCALRGYQAMSGGIYGDVSLHVSEGPGRISSYYVYAEEGLGQLRWKAEVECPEGMRGESRLRWNVKTSSGKTVREGAVSVPVLAADEVLALNWSCSSKGIEPWSVWEPNLHVIEVAWEDADGHAIDGGSRKFGLRRLESRDKRLYLNGRPIMLRGICEIYYFAPRIHPPNDVEYFKERLKQLKALGFNYLRFHTWVPMQPYIEAADEVGMLLGPEHSSQYPYNPLDTPRWADMIRWCRYHPSVVTYCGGNEEIGHEGLIAKFAERYKQAKALAPDALVIPMHTMGGPESKGSHADVPAPDAYADKDNYYKALWDRVTRNSDLFAARANDFSYSNFAGRDWREVEPEYTQYERPIEAHELGIIDTYINLDLEKRYDANLPSEIYEAARKNIAAAGRLDMAPKYYENSARWHGQARKYVTENLRKCDAFDGYDLLGAWDSHWHQSGYGCGLLNEFFELKPGDTQERVLQYNGESVLLFDNAKKYVFKEGETFDIPVMVSLYGGEDLKEASLVWRVLDGDQVVVEGQLHGLNAQDGKVTTLDNIKFAWPASGQSRHVRLSVVLKDSKYDLTNQWDLWVFADRPAPSLTAAADEGAFKRLSGRYAGLKPVTEAADAKLRIVEALTESDADFLASGGDVILLGSKPFPSNKTSFAMGCTGRPLGNVATVVNPHQALKYVVNDGWCDWQFKGLLENGACIEFNKIPVAFEPIVEVVSSYKYIRLQSAMWEAKTEGGRLFAASLNINMDDPAAVALMDGIVEYVQSDAFQPKTELSVENVVRPLIAGKQFTELKGYDCRY